MKGKEMYRVIEQAGWTLKRVNGSHRIYAKGSETRIVSVRHCESLGPPIIGRISKLFGLTIQ